MTGKLNTKRTVHKRNLDDKYIFHKQMDRQVCRWIKKYKHVFMHKLICMHTFPEYIH